MEKLAIDGGKPVFGTKTIRDFYPSWPIPYPETKEKLIEIYDSGKWGMCDKYEKMLMPEFAKYQGAKYSVWMCNGTTTLECALLALGIGPGDEVIVPDITWLATAEAPLYIGATPVIVDVDPETMCIDPAAFEAAITPRTKAVIPVHIYSALADMPKITAIAKKHNLSVIEDCAHAHGSRQKGIGVGSHGLIGSFSFQLSKLMTAGEGGCCVTNDEDLFDKIFRLSHIGSSQLHPGTKPDSSLLCHQYRFTDFQAAIIYDQIQHQPEVFAKRNENLAKLTKLLKGIPGIKLQKSSYEDDERGIYFFTMLLQPEELHEGITRLDVTKALQAEGFNNLFGGWGAPLHKMSLWNVPENKYIVKENPVAEKLMTKQVLVCGHQMLLGSDEMLKLAAAAVRKVMTAYAG